MQNIQNQSESKELSSDNDMEVDVSVFEIHRAKMIKTEKERLSDLEVDASSLQFQMKQLSEKLAIQNQKIARVKAEIENLESMTLEKILTAGKLV